MLIKFDPTINKFLQGDNSSLMQLPHAFFFFGKLRPPPTPKKISSLKGVAMESPHTQYVIVKLINYFIFLNIFYFWVKGTLFLVSNLCFELIGESSLIGAKKAFRYYQGVRGIVN